MVINLINSTYGYIYYKIYKPKELIKDYEHLIIGMSSPNKDYNTGLINYNKLKLFMKDTILPLAYNNKAIIVTSGLVDCTLTSTISAMAADEFKSYKGIGLPFYLLCIIEEEFIEVKALTNKGSFSYALRNASKNWKRDSDANYENIYKNKDNN